MYDYDQTTQILILHSILAGVMLSILLLRSYLKKPHGNIRFYIYPTLAGGLLVAYWGLFTDPVKILIFITLQQTAAILCIIIFHKSSNDDTGVNKELTLDE